MTAPDFETVARRPTSKPTYADDALAFIRQGDGPSLTDIHREIRPNAPLSSLNATHRDVRILLDAGLVRTMPGVTDGGHKCVRHYPADES